MVLSTASFLQLVWSPTDLNFLSLGLYNNLTSTLLPASVTISHSIQPLDSQGHILIFLDRMHLLFTQVHFLFWQLGRVRGQYTSFWINCSSSDAQHKITRTVKSNSTRRKVKKLTLVVLSLLFVLFCFLLVYFVFFVLSISFRFLQFDWMEKLRNKEIHELIEKKERKKDRKRERI